MVDAFNLILGAGGFVTLIATIILFGDLFLFRGYYFKDTITPLALPLAALISVFGIATALTYSEIFGFVPCGLCWFQRVFIFPQVFIAGPAFFLKDHTFAPIYGILLSTLGLFPSFYQHYLQMGGTELVPCPATGLSADCAERILFEFNFITLPLLATIACSFLIALYLYARKA